MKLGHDFSAAILGTLGPVAALTLLAATAHGQFTFTDVADEASLVALWELNEPAGSGTVTDRSGNYTGTLYGTPVLGVPSAMTTLGTAAYFSGASGNRIDVPFDAALNPQSYTIQAWAQARGSAGTWRSPLTSRDGDGGGYVFYASINDTWTYNTGSGWSATPGHHPPVIFDQWVHLAATYDNTSGGNRIFYINGHPVASGTGERAANSEQPFRIGAGGTGGSGSFWFNGAVDDVAVLNQPLAHQNIANHYNAKSNYAVEMATDGPAAYWRLGEQAGTSAYNALDVTSHTGTYSNVALRQMATPIGNDIDTAASFAHSSARVAVPSHADINPAESFTIEAWARVDGGQGNYRSVLTSRTTAGGGSHGFIFYATNTNRWSFWNGTGSTSGWHAMNGPDVVVGEWAHLVGTYDAAGQKKTFYVDGIEVASATGVTYSPNTATDFFIGMGGNTGTQYAFDGLIDEVVVYSRAVTPSVVNRHFLLGSTGAELLRWNGAGTGTLWGTSDNWEPAGSPAEKIVVFDNTDASATAGVVTNTVDADYTVASIVYENSGENYHTTAIDSDFTLTLASDSGSPRIFVADSARIDGQLSGNQGMDKYGPGTLTLGGSGGSAMNIGGSGVTVTEGMLRLERANLSFDTGVFHANTAIRVESGATLEIAQKWNVRHSNVVAVDGGTLNFTWKHPDRDDSENYLNYLNLTDATVTGYGIRVGNASSALFTITGDAGTTISNPVILVNNATTPRTLTFDVADGAASNDLILSGVILDYNESLAGTAVVKTGAGTLRLDGQLAYTGETMVNGGMLVLNGSGTLSSGSPGQFGSAGRTVTVNSGATLRLARSWVMGGGQQHHLVADGGTIEFHATNYQSNITLTGAAVTTAGNRWRVGLYGDALITVNPSDVASTIDGSIVFVKSGSRGEKTTFNVADGEAEYDLIVSSTISDYSEALSGMKLVKDGPGTMVLSGASTFNGGVDVNAGTLLVNNTSGSGTGTGPVAVNSGATLGGTGTIAGTTTVKGGGALATGAGVGKLTFEGDLTLEDDAVWDWEFINSTAGNYGQAVGVEGAGLILPTEPESIALNIFGLSESEGYGLSAGDRFTLYDGDVYVGSELLASGQNVTDLFRISDDVGWWGTWELTGGSLILTAVPEPGTWLLLLPALTWGLLLRRRSCCGTKPT